MATEYNRPKIVTDNLILCVDAGNTKSYPGNGPTWYNLVTLTSGIGANTGNVTLKSGGSLNTYSSNNGGYFTTPRAFVPNPGGGSFSTFTYSVWCYPTTLSGYRSIIDQDNDDWLLAFHNTSLIIWDPTITVPSFTASTNTWYNIVVTHLHASPISFYVNGVHKHTTSTNHANAPDVTNWSIGAGGVTSDSSGDGEVFDGRISTICIYNRVLTAAEIKQNYDAHKGRYGL